MSTFFLGIYALWFVSELVMNLSLRAGATDKQGADRSSLVLIWATLAIAITGGILLSSWAGLRITGTGWIAYAGLGLIIAGMVFRLLAVASLGRLFTVNVTIRRDHALKTDGFYKYIRHPAYAGSLLSFLGFGLSLNNWGSLAVVVIPTAMAFLYRIRTEEQVLTATFGEAYIAYRRKTRALIPFIL